MAPLPRERVIAGRCECGMAFAFIARQLDQHLRCYGLRWCRVKGCGELAEVGKDCKPCKRRRNRVNTPRWLSKPENRAKRNAYSRAWEASRRRGDAPTYQRQKAHKRSRYAQKREAA